MPGEHALLSASAAERWLNCPPSARLEEHIPETESGYADEGSHAHTLCELKVRKKFEVMKKSEFDKRLKAIKENPLFKPDMEGYANAYLDHILGIVHKYKTKPYIAIERKLDYAHIAPGGYGTCDCVLLCKDDLHIVDFKYGVTDGKGGGGTPVRAENNPQLMLYALGAAKEFSALYDIKNVTLHIVQPRLPDGISSWGISSEALTGWGESIKDTAILADKGEGAFKCGGWCHFCRAKTLCRSRSKSYMGLEELIQTPKELLTNAEIGEILSRAKTILNWVKSIEEYALNEVLTGHPVEGWKAVEGRGVRRINNFDAAFDILKNNGYEEAILYEKKPLTLTALENIIGRGPLGKLIGEYITDPQGKPTLVPADDKREEYSARSTAADDFGGL